MYKNDDFNEFSLQRSIVSGFQHPGLGKELATDEMQNLHGGSVQPCQAGCDFASPKGTRWVPGTYPDDIFKSEPVVTGKI